jgi:hypothetical protein
MYHICSTSSTFNKQFNQSINELDFIQKILFQSHLRGPLSETCSVRWLRSAHQHSSVWSAPEGSRPLLDFFVRTPPPTPSLSPLLIYFHKMLIFFPGGPSISISTPPIDDQPRTAPQSEKSSMVFAAERIHQLVANEGSRTQGKSIISNYIPSSFQQHRRQKSDLGLAHRLCNIVVCETFT